MLINISIVLLKLSSTASFDDVFCLLKADDRSEFFTKDSPKSFVKASLKNSKTFVLSSYMRLLLGL